MTIWLTLARTLRPIAESSLPDRAVTQVATRTRAAGGGITLVWNAQTSNIPCRLAPADIPENETLTAEQLRAWARWYLYVPMSTPIAEGMRVVVTGHDLDGTAWTRTLDVVAVDGPKTYEVLRMATCIDILTQTAGS